ncbi:MAG: 23S rRNA (uracil(1939)-C(5))-methyltransferase RlmD [Balneolaceae bacterium]
MTIKKGSVVEVEIDSAAFEGKGVGRLNGMAVFVPGTAPGDRVLARVVKKKKKYCEAKLEEVLSPSPERIEPRCCHADVCGGCNWQHIPYEAQLRIKEQQVRDHVERLGGLNPEVVESILGSDTPFYYRNKMEYSFGNRRWLSREEIERDEYVDDQAFAAGLHAPGRFDKILNLKECHLQNPVSYRLLDEVRNWCIQHDIPAYDTKRHKGFMRHLVVRNAHYTDDLMVNLVTSDEDPERIGPLAVHLLRQFPEITTLVNNVNDQPNPTAVGQTEHVLHGNGYIVDHLGDYQFKISANAFFQTNTRQAEKLYSTALDFAGLNRNHILYDLYCGVGTLSLFMSRYVRKVVGIELVDVAVENARENARQNEVDNVHFVKGDMKDTFHEQLLQAEGDPDCIITDPPRAGMHPDVVKRLNELSVSHLIYVSCNPSTLARDLKELSDAYHVERVKPVDMFPQTYHIEAIASLSAKSSRQPGE